MAEAARVLGKGLSITHKGKSYTISPLDIDMYAMFECWLESRAFGRVERQKGRCSQDQYRDRLAEVTKLVTSGAYHFAGPLALQASRTIDGQKYLLFLQLGKLHPEVTDELAGEIWDAQSDEVQARQEAMSAAPNSSAPSAA